MKNYLIPVIPFSEPVLARGEGSYVYDVNGKKYLDLNSGQFCTVFGHSNNGLVNAINEISQTLIHTSSSLLSDVVLEASEMMHKISGDMKAYSIFLSTGAEAVEFAIRYAKHITGREGIICFDKGYHGLTLGTQSITFSGVYAVPHVEKTFGVPIPDTFCSHEEMDDCIKCLKEVVAKQGKNIAAVLVEPIVSVGGMIFPQKKYFHVLYQICKENDILLIFDECQTGFGRTGEWFYYQQLGIAPDMVVTAKGIGLGYPVSVVMFNEYIIKNSNISMTHYSSHQNDPFSAAIVKYGINYIYENNLLLSIRKKGDMFLQKLKEMCKKNSMYINPRGNGLMLGVDINIEGQGDYRPFYKMLSKKAEERGLLIQGTDGGRVLRFLPDYLIEEKDMDFSVDVLTTIRF